MLANFVELFFGPDIQFGGDFVMQLSFFVLILCFCIRLVRLFVRERL